MNKYLEKHNYKIWQGPNNYWYTYLPVNDNSNKTKKLIKKLNKSDLNNAIIEYWKEQETNPTLEEIFNEWNDRRLELKKIAPGTHLRNQYIFKKHFAEIKQKRIKQMSIFDFTEFLEEQIPLYNLQSRAFSNLKAVAKGMVKYARKKRYIDYNADDINAELDISEKSFKKVIKEDYQEVFNEEETDKMIDYLINNKDLKNLAILFLFVTGLRIGELVALKHSDFDGNVVNVRRTESAIPSEHPEICKTEYIIKEFPKTSAGVRSVVIPSEFGWLVDKLSKGIPDEYVFVENGKRMTTNCVRKRLERVCKWNNIYHKSPHKIRKTYGTILLDNNIDKRLILGQMGHSDISCTETYYHRNRRSVDRKKEILDAIPDFSKHS